MQEFRSEIFARMLIRPNHYDNKGFISWKCFIPRIIDTDGVSVFRCDVLELIDLTKRGQTIAKSAKKSVPDANFYGLLFFLAQSAGEKFRFVENTRKSGEKHYTIKHKDVDYRKAFPEGDLEITHDHNDLFRESLIISEGEINAIRERPAPWAFIFDELVRLINENS